MKIPRSSVPHAGVEAARHFAQQILAHGGDRVADQIDYALQRCLGRAASDEELERYTAFLNRQLDRYKIKKSAALKLLDSEVEDPQAAGSAAPQAAWTLLASVLLNLDETISKP